MKPIRLSYHVKE